MAVSVGDAFVDVRPDLSSFNSGLTSAFGSSAMTSKFRKHGALIGGAIAGGFAAVGIGKMLFDIGQEFDEAFDQIQIKTGATGKEMGKFRDDFKDVFASVPVSADDAATAIAGLGQRMDVSHKQIRGLSKQILALSKITDTDVQENVESITRLFGDWSIRTKDQSGTLDELFRLTQVTGIGFSDLSRLMVQFGSPLRQLGFGFEESAAMFARFEREGVNMQTLLPGLRMALKNIAVPTDDLSKLFKKLGVSTKDPHDALLQIFDLLSKDQVSEADQTLLASSVFGGRAWADMKAAIEEGRFEFGDLIKTMKSGHSTIRGTERSTRDFSEQWQLFSNRLKVAIEPIASGFFRLIGDGMKQVSQIVGDRNMDWGQKLDRLLSLFTGWLGDLTERAVKAAPSIAGALIRGFLNAPGWAKLAVGTFLVAKMGGWTAIRALGSRIGGTLFGGLGGRLPGTTGGTIGQAVTTRGSSPANPVWVQMVGGGVPGPGGRPVPVPAPGPSEPGWLKWAKRVGLVFGVGAEFAIVDKLSSGAATAAIGDLFTRGFAGVTDVPPHGGPQGPATRGQARMQPVTGLPPGLRDDTIKQAIANKRLGNSYDDLADSARSGIRVVVDEIKGLRDRYGSLNNAADHMSKAQRENFIDVAKAAEDAGLITRDQLRKVIDAFRNTSDKTGKAADDQRRRVSEAAAKQAKNVLDSYHSLNKGVNTGLNILKDNTNRALKALGLDKPVQFRTNEAPLGAGGVGHRAPMRQGGLAGIVPGADTGDHHVLSVGGVPLARVSGREGIFVGNKTLMENMAMANALFPRLAQGGQALGVTRHYPHLSGDTDFLPALGQALSAFAAATVGHIDVTSGYRSVAEQAALFAANPNPTMVAPPGQSKHGLGYAADIAPAPHGQEGRFGLTYPMSWEPWHIELAAGGAKGAVAIWKDIARVILQGPPGRTTSTGQGGLDRVWNAANAYGRRRSGALGLSVATGPIQQMARAMVMQLWGAGQWPPFASLEMAEAGWNPRALNASSGAAGLAQALPASKYPPGAWPYTGPESAKLQLEWMMRYIQDRYGNPASAWAFHQANNWYGNGADFITNRRQMIGVGERGPERVTITPLGDRRRYKMRITNWQEGWAEVEEVAHDAAADRSHRENRRHRQSRH